MYSPARAGWAPRRRCILAGCEGNSPLSPGVTETDHLLLALEFITCFHISSLHWSPWQLHKGDAIVPSWGHWGSKKLNDLAKVPWLESGRASLKQASWQWAQWCFLNILIPSREEVATASSHWLHYFVLFLVLLCLEWERFEHVPRLKGRTLSFWKSSWPYFLNITYFEIISNFRKVARRVQRTFLTP